MKFTSIELWVQDALAAPDAPFLIKDVLPRAGLVFLSGEPKVARKTWLAFGLAMSMASGKRWSEFEPTGRYKVAYLALEGGAKPTAGRFPMLEAGSNITLEDCAGHFFMLHGERVNLDLPGDISELLRFVKENEISCIFIDTLSAAFLEDENGAEAVKKMLNKLHHFRDMGCAVVVVHHVVKSNSARGGAVNPGMDLRGSSALAGAFDSILAVYEFPVEGEIGKWLFVRGKDVEDFAFKLEWKGLREGRAELHLDRWDTYPIPDAPIKK